MKAIQMLNQVRRQQLRRSMLRAITVGVVLSVSPMVAGSPAVLADAPRGTVAGLSQGARGDAVRALQQALVSQGIAVPGGVDGVYGAGTTAAVKEFQAAKGLSATGAVDEATALALGLASSPLLGLAQGSKGDAVKDLQNRLINAGLSVAGGADGVFGGGTATALKQFQSNKGLSASGAVDAATAAALGSVTSTAPAAAAQPAPAQPAPAASSAAGIKMGARGDAVKALQEQLIAAGFGSILGKADGVFGLLTANALSSFQNSVGLKANAILDDATAGALADAAAKAAPAAPAATPAAAPAASPASPLLGLKYGATGEAVKSLQQALINAGVTVKGGADGVYGTGTIAAVKAYQTAVGLNATGKVDEATASALAAGKSAAPAPAPAPAPAANGGLVGLKSGSLGPSVKYLQESLIKLGFTIRGGADGIFGPATSKALSAFQESQGIAVTGAVDDATMAAFNNPKAINPPASGGGSTSGFPVFGERGNRVMALQGALVQAGIAVKGGVDGEFGAGTSAAIMNFQRAKGLRVTGKVDEATAAALGLTKAPAPTAPAPASVNISVFPVQGYCQYIDTYGAARGGGRVHLGVDVIAPAGKLIYAVVDGTITKVYNDYPGALAGNAVRLTMGDGTYFFYAHMSSFAEGIGVGVPVRAGQAIGYVGSTGSSGTNHLHLEVHPKGGSAVNPYPIIKAVDACSVTTPRG